MTIYIGIGVFCLIIIILAIGLMKAVNKIDDLRLKVSKKDSEYWNQAAGHQVTIKIINKQKEHLERKLRKYTAAYLYTDFKE